MASLSRLMGTIVTLAFAGCANNGAAPVRAGALDPASFFLGHTHGDAELHKLLGSPVRVTVEGVGRKQSDTLILDQTTREGQQPPKTRRWVMQKIGANRYSGTLTDATGPVSIRVDGPVAYIRYKMSGGLTVRQQLTLQPDGTTILNKLYVTKFGIQLATLQETIRKLD